MLVHDLAAGRPTGEHGSACAACFEKLCAGMAHSDCE